MNKPRLLFNYEYTMMPWSNRIPRSLPYQLEQALSEFFEVTRDGASSYDVVLNTLPLALPGDQFQTRLFKEGPVTFFWNPTPLENLWLELVDKSDVVFCSSPVLTKEYGDKGRLLLSAVDPEFHYYPEEPLLYDVGFLGSEIESYRINFLNELEKHFKVLRGRFNLGEESARKLSQCKLIISINDYWEKEHGIEHRFWTHGNIRPIVFWENEDIKLAGFEPGRDFIPYRSVNDAVWEINNALRSSSLEKMYQQIQNKFKKHQWRDRALQVYNTFKEFDNETKG